MNFGCAIECLERAISLSNGDARMLKRLARLRVDLKEWADLLLTPDQLRDLGKFLTGCGAGDERNGRTLKFTEEWVQAHGGTSQLAILDALRKRGGVTDYLVLCNVVQS